MEKSTNIHANHRNRLKQRFIKEGLISFEDHNILELLLFYSVPRKDTNEMAHRLLKKFGSLASVFDADINQLTECEGISENTAVLIKMIPQLSRAYNLNRYTRYPTFATTEKIGKYLVNYYIGQTNEKLIALYLNGKLEVIDTVVISEGTVTSSHVDIRKIVEEGIKRKAAFVVLAHNHPDGVIMPSAEDKYVTGELEKILNKLAMPLLEHYIVGIDGYYKLMTCGEWKMEIV